MDYYRYGPFAWLDIQYCQWYDRNADRIDLMTAPVLMIYMAADIWPHGEAWDAFFAFIPSVNNDENLNSERAGISKLSLYAQLTTLRNMSEIPDGRRDRDRISTFKLQVKYYY